MKTISKIAQNKSDKAKTAALREQLHAFFVRNKETR